MNAGPSAPEAVAAIAMTEEGPRIIISPVKRQNPNDMLLTIRIMGYLQDGLYRRFLEQPGWIGERSDIVTFTWSDIQREKLGPYFPKYGPDASLGVAKSVNEGITAIRHRDHKGNVYILGYPYVPTTSSDAIDQAGLQTLQGVLNATGEIVPPSRLGAQAIIKLETGKRDPVDTDSLIHVDNIELASLDAVVKQLRLLNEGAMEVRNANYSGQKLPVTLSVAESAPIISQMQFSKPS